MTQIDDLESSVNELRTSVAAKLDRKTFQAIMSTFEVSLQELVDTVRELNTSSLSWSGEVSALNVMVKEGSKPLTVPISGGQVNYAVEHNLGYKPVVQVLNAALSVDDQLVQIRHDGANQFTVITPSTSYTGTILYR